MSTYDLWRSRSVEPHLEWCEKCSEWEGSSTLTLCKIQAAVDSLGHRIEPGNQLPAKERPWRAHPHE